MRHLFGWQLTVVLLLGWMTAAAQVPNSNQNTQAPGSPTATNTTSTAAGETSSTPMTLTPGVTVTGKMPDAGRPLPKLPPDEFEKCNRPRMGLYNPDSAGISPSDLSQMGTATWVCAKKVSEEMQFVVDSCLNRTGSAAPLRIIQACTESLDHKLLERDQLFFLVGSRAGAYFASGDWQHALEDYDAAIKLAPHYGELYYDRGVVFASRSNDAAALQDFDTAMGFDPKLVVPSLLQRARIYAARNDLSGALADYSKAISLQPKTAALWSGRGYVDLGRRDYNDAVKDEAQAIQLDPKLARAYYLRGVAFGDLGNRANAVDDLRTAVAMDASLARYVLIQGKNVTLTLPPL
jgi:Tfp pilus assembly protein PilF